ncbi:MAG: hypothetical protein WBF66_07065 [Dehalococcoidia bacterium]
MPKEPPGPRVLREFMECLSTVEGVDEGVATVLQELHARGELKASAIVAALRKAREGTEQTRDENREA